ncbi:M15 family metallopeptidase [Streptosporangium sp. NPDC023615]|uniref:M15 family metallopeptidase n=1 Tax=Streptosporangium sp. NPDC023615 TaxID=3154794 RepID=UPI003415AE16
MPGPRFTIHARATLAVTVGCLTAAACGTAASPSGPAPPAASAPVPAPSPTTPVDPTGATPTAPEPTGTTPAAPGPTEAAPTPTGPPPFSAKVSRVTRDRLRYSWRPGCPVPVGDLRLITMTHWGFDDRAHTGELVVHRAVTEDVVSVFRRLYDWRWPIRRMQSVDVYRGDDFDSIDADNTSAFNCRPATGSNSWSRHAYGRAVDINPRENPYVYANGSVAHANARRFAGRPMRGKGVINPGDRVVRAFEREGWEWGGDWSGIKDYQHFSKGGG